MTEFNPFTLAGKNILVTGASSGIGRQCAVDCSRMGAKVVLVARNEKRLQATLSSLEGDGHSAYSFDLRQTEGLKGFVSSVVRDNGKISGLLHCAGVEITQPVQLLTDKDYEEAFRVNALSAFELVRQLCPPKHFMAGGSIVLISSITSVIARNGLAAYSASKGALVSGARVFASELAKRKIRVNCISPGTILTPMMESYLSSLSEEDQKRRLESFPLGLGQTSDISFASIYLLSDASRWVTGQNIVIDGGFTMK